jgi:hypothetical protein
MTRWVGWCFVWLSVIGLLWIINLEASVSSLVGPSVGPWSNPVPASLSVLGSTSPPFIRTRADAFESPTALRANMTAREGGPPWLETRAPLGACGDLGCAVRLPATPAAPKRGNARFFPGNSWPEWAQRKNQSFATAFS